METTVKIFVELWLFTSVRVLTRSHNHVVSGIYWIHWKIMVTGIYRMSKMSRFKYI